MSNQTLSVQPDPPSECKTEAEKIAYVFGWWKALESVRPVQPADKDVEIARLTVCLKTANANAENFERQWYLRGDEIEAMQAKQEPVGYVYKETDYLSQDKHLVGAIDDQTLPVGTALYTSPPQRQPLIGSEIWQMVNDCSFNGDLHADKFARAIEAKHGIGDKTAHITKTRVEDGKLITQVIPKSEIYKREWVGLTDEEFNDAVNYKLTPRCIAIAIDAKLKEKNA